MTAEPVRRPGPLLERAFELAASGECRTMDDMNRALRKEGYLGHALRLHGPIIHKQLQRLMDAAGGEPRAETATP